MSRTKGALGFKGRRSIETWKECYRITLKNKIAYQTRLKELETWDNCNGHEQERQSKIEALKELLNNKT